ncbi:endonuclease, putative [Plasmodium ovale wallikeri]|uniref:Endonuclease, putative n=2 Tax=Plasmodium ovale TaxID=36330 RepID=A0A1A8YSB5_PLAOA|nr:endonuclease, putative [Plasmodium ovale wallikeri]SBT34533.1 endonuclease, putative [Plasmodium ovale wallikeri]SBT76638.1 endonuclease, putative [Plasmodium ovale]
MTIKGFIQFVNKKIPSTIKRIDDIKKFEGKKFIIDGTFFIYKFMYVAWKHILNDKNRESKYKGNELTTHVLIRQYIIKKSIELLKNQHEYFKSLKINTLYIIEDIGARCELQPVDYKCKKHVWKERDYLRKKKNLFDILNVDISRNNSSRNGDAPSECTLGNSHNHGGGGSGSDSDSSSNPGNSIGSSNARKTGGTGTVLCDRIGSNGNMCEKKYGKKEKMEIIVDEDGIHDLFKKNIFIKINSRTANDIYNCLVSENIPIFITKNDAEKECAIQCSHEKDIVVSDDTDALAFGAPNLIRFITNKKKRHIINKDELLSELNINYEQFIDFCILSGCDYSAKIPGIGPVKAYEIIKKYKKIETFLESSAFNKYKNSKLFNQKLDGISMSLNDYIVNEFTYEQARKVFFNSY